MCDSVVTDLNLHGSKPVKVIKSGQVSNQLIISRHGYGSKNRADPEKSSDSDHIVIKLNILYDNLSH